MKLSTSRLPGMVMSDHIFQVPLDHADPRGEQISVYGRELTTIENEKKDLPWLVFFEGGPGFPSPRPGLSSHGILTRGIKDYRVLLLDQRGVGRSTPANHESIVARGKPQQQADYLKNFRADSIVKDCEIIRKELNGEGKWSVVGHSFGGFIVLTYLSFAPHGLREAMIAGGLAPIGHTAEEVYRRTYRRVAAKNQLYYARYPEDVESVRAIVKFLRDNKVTLPTGGRLTAEAFLQLGILFGYSYGFDTIHYLVEGAFQTINGKKQLPYAFLRGVENNSPFDIHPIYAILHEAIYCEGTASRWAANRVISEFPEFSPASTNPVLFTGEMLYPWNFEHSPILHPLREAAEILANYDGWPKLYDTDILKKNSVPTAAVAYYDDMYVDLSFAEETAAKVGGIRLWVTNELEHDGLRNGEYVLNQLIELVNGKKVCAASHTLQQSR